MSLEPICCETELRCRSGQTADGKSELDPWNSSTVDDAWNSWRDGSAERTSRDDYDEQQTLPQQHLQDLVELRPTLQDVVELRPTLDDHSHRHTATYNKRQF